MLDLSKLDSYSVKLNLSEFDLSELVNDITKNYIKLPDNKTIKVILENCLDFLKRKDTIYISDVYVLLQKALDGIETKKDLTPVEIDVIKRIRYMIKGL